MLFAIGGDDGDGTGARIGKMVELYSADRDTWILAPPMPTYRCGMGVATLDGLVYVAGGWNGAPLKTVEIYDASNSSWTTGKPINQSRQDASAVAVDGKVLLAGGCSKPTRNLTAAASRMISDSLLALAVSANDPGAMVEQ